jgi:hypothetical protein
LDIFILSLLTLTAISTAAFLISLSTQRLLWELADQSPRRFSCQQPKAAPFVRSS